jgi:hypothetical protein
MTGKDLPIPASASARSLASFCLIAITAILLQLVLRLDTLAHQMIGQPGAELALLKTHAFALLLGVLVMLDIAWFRSLLRAQAMEAQMRPARTLGRRR